jgi:hypothetical protein
MFFIGSLLSRYIHSDFAKVQWFNAHSKKHLNTRGAVETARLSSKALEGENWTFFSENESGLYCYFKIIDL